VTVPGQSRDSPSEVQRIVIARSILQHAERADSARES